MIIDTQKQLLGFEELQAVYIEPDYDPQLDLYHNTRHASESHASIKKDLKHLRSAWLSRFDWVLDVGLQAGYKKRPHYILTRQRERPRTVFINLRLMTDFVVELLPRLEQPAVLYIGNVDFPVSHCNVDLLALAEHPKIAQIFCENKNIPSPKIRAMPIGIDPYDLVKGSNGFQLLSLAKRVEISKKKLKVMAAWSNKRTLHLTRNDREIYQRWIKGDESLFQLYSKLSYNEYRKSMAQHRFALAPWGDSYDTSRIFEALILKTIPIIFSGPYTEAYKGLPVVVINRLSDITETSLDQWWEQLHTLFEDPDFLGADYWWKKVKSACPARKVAYLVVGPESSGNHLVTDILCHAGCHGQSGDHTDWQQTDGDRSTVAHDDLQPWDVCMPDDQDPIVWRRSVPHLEKLPNIAEMVASLEARDYTVTVVVVTREKYATVQSQIKWGHIINTQQGLEQIEQSYQHIFQHIKKAGVAHTLVNYESLVNYAHASKFLLIELGLKLPKQNFSMFDGNIKWGDNYRLEEAHTPLCSPSGQGSEANHVKIFDFPEHWFNCKDRESESRYADMVRTGYKTMQHKSLVICSIARDVADDLPVYIQLVEALGDRFQKYHVVIYENDSSDSTLSLLKAWQQRNKRLTLISQVLNRRKWGQVDHQSRTRDLAEYRNQYLDHVKTHYADYDYSIVIDADNRKGFSIDGIASSFATSNWHAYGSNGLLAPEYDVVGDKPMFFDSYAFRYPGDLLETVSGSVSDLVFDRGDPRVSVWSCFGGLALYKMSAFLSGAQYRGGVCEHVAFHYDMRENGFGNIFLNPSQIVLYSD